MKDLNIPGSQSTPSILSDSASGRLHLSGDSYPENSFELYGPVIQWVDEYLAADRRPLTLTLELQYLNTSSVKAVMDIFDLLEAAHADGREVCVNWYYDSRNERVGELAEEFKEDCTFPFNVIGR
ncbi:biofilm regulation phosphoprotein SiaC [Bordetella genomosp. 9]|uniref:SiaC family regulatory phosphoprotein domain-containing protein n=1 Tax=Bordetella genomosp. 9 TaxID=1416803 RepID=A0A1W6Z5A3_9BORD|nr:biofilm regulation phosphoprotein SiaC [Bordetella genomosp. 9]ARP87983.1 hypothetical protein CAL13_18515 [Bordetella genomosp. 9]ARP91938.1 hypothetical protein CAL14_17970 [Bordetella genomosp. 9]